MKDFKEMTSNEKTLRAIISDKVCDLIGGWECMYCDEPNDEFFTGEHLYTKQDAIDTIYKEIMNDAYGTYVKSSRRWLALEKKHIRFMGADFVRELIKDRVEANYKKCGWDFPNNYEGK